MEKYENERQKRDDHAANPDHGVIPAGPEAHENEGQGKNPKSGGRTDRDGKKPETGETKKH